MTADTSARLVPKLRFPEFRDTPSWSAPQLADLYGFKRTNTLSRDKLNYETGTIRNIHYGDIHTKFKPLFRVRDECVPYINPDASVNELDDGAFCEEGDIIFADASEDLDDVGKAIELVSLDGERVVSGTHTILANRHKSVPVVGFGGHLFQCATVRSRIKKEAQGTKVYGISAKRISFVLVPIPSTLAEQQKIADCLGSLDDLIAAEDRKLEALRQHKQGLMQQLFPQPGETVPRWRFPEFRNAPLNHVRLWDLTQESRTRNGNRLSSETVMGVKKADGIVPMESRLVTSDISRYKIVQENWFAYNPMRLNIGSIARWQSENDVLVSPDYVVFRCLERLERSTPMTLLPEYLDSFCGSKQWDAFVSEAGDGGVRVRIYYRDIAQLQLVLPSIEEQTRIADCLGSLDDLIEAQDRKLEALRQHKQGLMQQLFPSLEDR